MVICKYFPNCRYGDNCKFDHIYPSGQFSRDSTQQYYASNSYFQYANRSPVTLKNSNAMDVSEVMKVVIQEITQAEKGGQWPLSCFSPIKERPCFPSMQDYSPEEIRWRMYEANKNGTLAECQRQIKELYEEAKQKRNCLKNPSSEIYAIINKYYGHKADASAVSPAFSVDSTKTQSNNFGFSTQSFGGSEHNAQASVNGTHFKFSLPQLQAGNTIPQQQTILGVGSSFQTSQLVNNQPNIFGAMGNQASTTQDFGSATQNVSGLQTMQQNAFGSVVTGNVFGNVGAAQAPSMNMFGATQTKSGSIFGGNATAQTQPSSIFGGAGTPQMPPVNNVFAVGAPPQGSFGESNATLTSNKVFGRGDPTSVPPTGVFGGSSTPSISTAFGTTNSTITPTENVFGRPSAIPASNNSFGQISAFGSSAGLSKPESNGMDGSLYTLKDELNQVELLAFSANTFTLGKVPTRPPPKELCC